MSLQLEFSGQGAAWNRGMWDFLNQRRSLHCIPRAMGSHQRVFLMGVVSGCNVDNDRDRRRGCCREGSRQDDSGPDQAVDRGRHVWVAYFVEGELTEFAREMNIRAREGEDGRITPGLWLEHPGAQSTVGEVGRRKGGSEQVRVLARSVLRQLISYSCGNVMETAG